MFIPEGAIPLPMEQDRLYGYTCRSSMPTWQYWIVTGVSVTAFVGYTGFVVLCKLVSDMRQLDELGDFEDLKQLEAQRKKQEKTICSEKN